MSGRRSKQKGTRRELEFAQLCGGQRRIQELTIPDWLPKQITNGHPSWKVAWAARQNAKQRAWAAAQKAGWTFMPGRVQLTITYVFPVLRTRDHDNLVARSIGIVNGLKKVFFEDDSTDCLTLIVKAEVKPKEKRTVLVLETMPAEPMGAA